MPAFISRIFPFLMSVFIYLTFSLTLFAQETVPSCQICYETHRDQTVTIVEEIETHYIGYRWIERKIREVYYNRMWRARLEARDPSDEAKREAGKAEDKRLIGVMANLREQSLEASNGVVQSIDKYLDQEILFGRCSMKDNEYRWCIRAALEPTYKLMDELKVHFEHVFEHEREYELAVKTVSGGRDGLYPYDTVEESVSHDEYYWRFEAQREEYRFAEDQKVMDLLHRVRQILTWDAAGSQCCYENA